MFPLINLVDLFPVDVFESERFSLYRNIAAVLGALWLFVFLVSELRALCSGFCAYVLAPWGICRTNLKKYGEWAVVTGASEGIGKGYALELARQGLNVVIMSRSLDKLTAVEREIKEKYKREVIVIPVDFSEGKPPKGSNGIYSGITEQLGDLDIGILVNNVGYSYDYPEFFLDIPEDKLRDVIELNCQAMVQMTHLVLKKMVQIKKHGIIVNISSASSLVPLQLYAVYSASKIFVNYFSEALRLEYGSKGISIQTVKAFYVATALSNVPETSFFIPDPITYARAAVATIGVQNETYGSLAHAIQGYLIGKTPRCVIIWSFWILLPMLNAHAKTLSSKKAE